MPLRVAAQRRTAETRTHPNGVAPPPARKRWGIVTRQEIVERLWGKDVFVDTEHGINTAVRKIRAALRDDIDRPRFIQTSLRQRLSVHRRPRKRKWQSTVATIENVASFRNPNCPRASIPQPSKSPVGGLGRVALPLLLIAGLLLAFNVAGLRDKVFAPHPRHAIHSLAVLPLANLSGDPAQDYFADGMTDELITMLAKNTSLRLVSRTSAMRFKGVQRPVKDIARELGVDGILEGSVERSGKSSAHDRAVDPCAQRHAPLGREL